MLRLEDFGGGPGVKDNGPAWRSMLDSIPVPSGRKPVLSARVELGAGVYSFGAMISDVRSDGIVVQLELVGLGASEHPVTTVRTAEGQAGIELHQSRVSDVTFVSARKPTSPPAPEAHGIIVLGPVHLDDVYVSRFPGNGIHISAGAQREPPTNANAWRLIGGKSHDNVGHGLYTDGPDTNAGIAIGFRANSNGGFGILDSSFLGNTYLGCPTASNKLGSIRLESGSGSQAIGCYVESGTNAAPQVARRSLWIGSMSKPEGAGGTFGMGTILDDGVLSGEWVVENIVDPMLRAVMNLGSRTSPRTLFELFAKSPDPALNSNKGLRLVYEAGWWRLEYASRLVLGISTERAVEGSGHVWAPGGLLVGERAARKMIMPDGTVISAPEKG